MDQEPGSVWQKIENISCDAAQQLKNAVDTENDLYTLTREDLNELLPGAEKLVKGKKKMAIISKISQQDCTRQDKASQTDLQWTEVNVLDFQEQAGPSVNSHPHESSEKDTEMVLISRSSLSEFQRMINTYIEKQLKECSEGAEKVKDPSCMKRSQIPQRSSVDEQNSKQSKPGFFSHFWGVMPSSSEAPHKRCAAVLPPPAKVHVLCSGNTLDAHKVFMRRLKVKMKECSVESCSVVLLFCPVTSRMGTDMEEAMKKTPVDKPVILVVMHHHHDPNLVLSPPVQLPKDNIVKVVQCIFHESQGLLQCDTNDKAIEGVNSEVQKFKLQK